MVMALWYRTSYEVVSCVRELVEFGRKHASLYRGRWSHSIVGAGKWQASDGLCAEVPLWCASGPIARRRIDLVRLEAYWLQEWEWVLEDCHKRSCWKNPIGMSVPVPFGTDVYVCSKSFRLCLTVVYWLLECNKVPSWIENPEYVVIFFDVAFILFSGHYNVAIYQKESKCVHLIWLL
jgi:hypothetical protein